MRIRAVVCWCVNCSLLSVVLSLSIAVVVVVALVLAVVLRCCRLVWLSAVER